MRCLLFDCCCYYCLSLFDTGQDAFTSYRATKPLNVFLVLTNFMLLFTESKMLVFTKSIVSKMWSARTKFIKLSISEKVTIGQSWCGGIHITYVRTQNNSKLDVKYLTRHGPLQHSTVVCVSVLLSLVLSTMQQQLMGCQKDWLFGAQMCFFNC